MSLENQGVSWMVWKTHTFGVRSVLSREIAITKLVEVKIRTIYMGNIVFSALKLLWS